PHPGGVLLTHEIGQIDRAVASVVRIDSDIDQTAMPEGQHLRNTGYGAGLAAGSDKLQPTRLFSDEERAVGQKSDRARLSERTGHTLGGQLRPLSQNDFGLS